MRNKYELTEWELNPNKPTSELVNFLLTNEWFKDYALDHSQTTAGLLSDFLMAMHIADLRKKVEKKEKIKEWVMCERCDNYTTKNYLKEHGGICPVCVFKLENEHIIKESKKES